MNLKNQRKVISILSIAMVFACLSQGCMKSEVSSTNESSVADESSTISTDDIGDSLNDESEDESEEEFAKEEDDFSYEIDLDADGVEVINDSDYDIVFRGVAKPSEKEVQIKEAAKTGVECIKENYGDLKEFFVDLVFLDALPGITVASWKGNIVIDHMRKYEFIIDAEDGSVLFANENF